MFFPPKNVLRKLTYCLLFTAQTLIFVSPAARADRRCPLPLPIAVGDTKMNVETKNIDQLSPEIQNVIFKSIPEGYDIFLIAKSNFSGNASIADYLLFYDNGKTARANSDLRNRLSVIRSVSGTPPQVFPVFCASTSKNQNDSELADVRPEDLIIYKSWNGAVYAKTIGYEHSECWETVVYWDSDRFVAENIFFNTSDGFNYPVGPKYPADIEAAEYPSGWRVDQGFQDCQNYPPEKGPCRHLGEDWNDKSGGESDLGHPVFAVSRGEVIFAGNGGPGWNGIVVLRHRPPTGEYIFSFYGHLNIDPEAIRPGLTRNRSQIRTVAETLQPSSPGRLVEVEKGGLVGYIGRNPEGGTGSHLHFEIIVDPNIAYTKSEWKGYRQLNGSESQWRDPSKFIEQNRLYWSGFSIGDDRYQNITQQVFKESYSRNGGLRVFGEPIGVVTYLASQAFENGEIYYHVEGPLTGRAFAILNPLLAKFRMLMPARTAGDLPEDWGYNPADVFQCPLGLPVADIAPESETSYFGTKFKFQNFQNGSLEFHQTGTYTGEVFEIQDEIFKRWSGPELKYAAGPLGLPISDEKEAQKSPVSGNTGRFSVFEGGVAHWLREKNKVYVIGLNQKVGRQLNLGKLIADFYKGNGGSGGRLGFPASDDYLWRDGVRCDFEGGYISWTPSERLSVVYK